MQYLEISVFRVQANVELTSQVMDFPIEHGCVSINEAYFFPCRVFELDPQIKKMMPEFMTADPVKELTSARKLFGHSKTIMKCLENAVMSLDDNDRFVGYLVELGRRHQVRPLKAQYLEVST